MLAHRPRSVDVDDLMQDVAVTLVAKLHTLREAGAFRPWLRQVVLNTCRGAARNLKPNLRLSTADRDDDSPDSAAVSQPATDDPSGTVELSARKDEARYLLEQVMGLPPDYREPLLLRCVQSMTYQQISEVLGLPVTTIETRLARARRMLREELNPTENADHTA